MLTAEAPACVIRRILWLDFPVHVMCVLCMVHVLLALPLWWYPAGVGVGWRDALCLSREWDFHDAAYEMSVPLHDLFITCTLGCPKIARGGPLMIVACHCTARGILCPAK